MRIQHNIIAMNAYRNYTGNTSAMQKNLERLSSGYKINRAGDDAAGLAISEKMRAQITGLEAASKNAKDGVSLVQTAEGALTEVHDMLNRMVELSTMSANGTYNSETDRTQLQKEVTQLKDEINRIADSANFNGIKLLDGSMDSTIKLNSKTATGLSLENLVIDAMNNKVEWHKNSAASETGSATKFSINIEQVLSSLVVTDGNDDGKVKINFEIWSNGGDYVVGGYKSDENMGDDGSKAIHGGEETWKDLDGNKAKASNVYQVSITVDSKSTVQEILNQLADEIEGKVSFKFAPAADVTATGGDHNAAGEITAVGNNVVDVEYEITAKRDDDGNVTGFTFEMTAAGQKAAQKFYDEKIVSANEDEKAAADNLFKANFNWGVFNADLTDDTNSKAWHSADKNKVWSTTIDQAGAPKGTDEMAVFVANLQNIDIKDGTGIQIGDDYYIFAGTDKTYKASYASNVHVVDIRDLINSKGLVERDVTYDGNDKAANKTTKMDSYGKFTQVLGRISAAAEGNSKFIVTANQDGTSLTITERAGGGIGDDLTVKANYADPDNWETDKATTPITDAKYTWAGLAKWLGVFTSVDMAEARSGDALTLQIGDTADEYNQLKVNIADCHTKAIGIDDIDISDQASAAEAVDKVKAAINTVSDIRGTLGATQNRLDHTLNNLSVMTENIQDAESTIRDTDVAEEMMAYTKNNILIQAAQAMLAQANQIPQGVLQLLQ